MKTLLHLQFCKSYRNNKNDFIFNYQFFRPYMVWDRIHNSAFLTFSSENKINISWDETGYHTRGRKHPFREQMNWINNNLRHIKELLEDEN